MKSALRVFLIFLAGRAKIFSEWAVALAATLEEKPIPRWIKKERVIYFTAPFLTNGWSREEWKTKFREGGYRLSDWTEKLIDSSDFVLSEAGIDLWAAIIPGEYFSDGDRVTRNIHTEAERLGLTTPLVELIFLIRLNFSNEEIRAMGLYWLIGMHNPITNSDGRPILLGADANGGDPWLRSSYDRPGGRWGAKDGFVFGAPASPLD